MKLYSIANWSELYEVSDSKKVSGPLTWVAVRTKTDGFGFARITAEKDRSDLLSAWYLMLGVAAKQRREDRGKLQRDGIPLTAGDLALMTHWPTQVFERAMTFFSDPKQGWLVSEEIRTDSDGIGSVPNVSESSGSTGQDRTGQDSWASAVADAAGKKAAKAAELSDEEWLATLKAEPAYAGIDVDREHGKAKAWCLANHKVLTRRRFINWLNRCEHPMHAPDAAPVRLGRNLALDFHPDLDAGTPPQNP